MGKLNIAELLKDCPSGMKLDCTLLEGLEFDSIVDNEYLPIRCRVKNPNGGYNVYNFTKYGCWFDTTFAKCVIFPKGKTTWEGFQRPFKDGDIIFVTNNESYESFHYKYIAIFKEIKRDKDVYVYGLYSYNEDVFSLHPYLCEITNSTIIKFATKEEKEKLFKAIKENGYKWNPETKTLEKLPKFKVGDKIVEKDNPFKYWYVQGIDTYCNSDFYYIVTKGQVSNLHFKDQDNWELVPNKFDITTLKPFDKVLVRDDNKQFWSCELFDSYRNDNEYPFNGIAACYKQCVPYEGNEHLLGTKEDCDDFYKTW